MSIYISSNIFYYYLCEIIHKEVFLLNQLLVREKITQFLLEDVGTIDITSETIFSVSDKGTAIFYAKETGVLSGMNIIQTTYQILDLSLEVQLLKNDGEKVQPNDKIAVVTGSVRSILMGERVILNLLQRMSGIATLTNQAVMQLNSNHTKICDTRKTTPGLRVFEKYAVTCGGGFNHRNGLYDGVMIKDNHISFCGSITKAIEKVREQVGSMVKIEVETETKEQVIEAVQANCDIIMFDNRTPEEIHSFLELVPESILTEASGGIKMESISMYRNTGVDYISLGFLTHSAPALDISLSMEGEF